MDPRTKKMAEVIVTYSTAVKPGERERMSLKWRGCAGMGCHIASHDSFMQMPASAGPPVPAPTTTPARPPLEPADEAPDSMSLTAQRLLTDLERKYEGTVATGEEEAADKPKRPRAKRAARVPREKPAGPA